MRVVVTGASGNVGSALVESLAADGDVDEVVGICRRPHEWHPAGVRWVWADIASDDLVAHLRGADVVVHLAWLFHPMRDPRVTWRNNVAGSARVLEAVAAAEVPSVVVASSVGAYAARHDLARVDESWPTSGVPETAYSREKAYVERLLDVHERDHPGRRVVRMRPAFTFHPRAAVQQRRMFLGPLVPHALLRPGRLPVLPLAREVRLQALQTRDAAAAYHSAVGSDVRGAFNLAAEPVLDPRDLARVLGARWLPVPARAMRAALASAFHARAVPTTPTLWDLLLQVPMMDTSRARDELGWTPVTSGPDAVEAFLRGGTGPTPPLADSSSGPARAHEVATGLGARDD